ncbi:hypothetical protein [Bifidobacterium callitrichidarum]|uniref:Uncharacterized protein n=1 Tax=Bifidobacterium callitrichidarum TaxID=2052941 RepID=A0A2U2N083_9BIFI|nr:hypothetical protein [Bifidobacterium callitrichidarum]PWG62655.1 hypothetical protein DF196_11900 [Bifidobacterium callitrichidarum]
MSSLKPLQRLTADVTIDLNPEIIVPSKKDGAYKLRNATVHMSRPINGRWSVDSVTGNGAVQYLARTRQGMGWRKAYYQRTDFEVTPELQVLVDEAVSLVREDCRKALQSGTVE